MITDFLSAILEAFKEGFVFRRARREERDAALDAIYVACTETRAYVVLWERTRKRNPTREKILARAWMNAATRVRDFDEQLARKCHLKWDYWLDPEKWDDRDAQRLRLDLDRVSMEAFDLKVMDDEKYERKRLRRNTQRPPIPEDDKKKAEGK